MLGISIIIVSFNSEAIIEPTISCLLEQQNTEDIPWEVVFVNNNSTDDTVEKVLALFQSDSGISYKIVNENRPGTAFARFRGVSEAKFDIICFVDDDNRVANNWVQKAFQLMQNTEIGILGCGGTGQFEAEPPAWFEEEKEAYAIGALYPEHQLVDTTYDANLPTAGMCVRKEVFENLQTQNWEAQLTGRIGGSMAPGEDTELCQAARLLGYKTFYTNQLHFEHYMPKSRITWERFLAMTYGFGVTDVFLLPYKLEYEKTKLAASINYFLRKKWYINYLGKKTSLFLQFVKFKSGKISRQNFDKLKARNNGFCETILKEKQKFAHAFFAIKRLKKIK